jgi:hypothetical protein
MSKLSKLASNKVWDFMSSLIFLNICGGDGEPVRLRAQTASLAVDSEFGNPSAHSPMLS